MPSPIITVNALTTLARVKEELHEKGNQYDGIIQSRINALSQTFENTTGWCFKERQLADYRANGAGTYCLLSPLVPVASITKIEIHDPYTDALTTTLNDPTAYALRDRDQYGVSFSGLIQLFNTIPMWGVGNVGLYMTVGMQETHPRWTEGYRLLMMQIRFEYTSWQNNEAGVIAKSFADGNISFAPRTNLLLEVSDGLKGLDLNMRAF